MTRTIPRSELDRPRVSRRRRRGDRTALHRPAHGDDDRDADPRAAGAGRRRSPEARAEDAVKLDPAQAAKLDDMVASLPRRGHLARHARSQVHEPRQRHRQARRRRHPRLGQRLEPPARQADGGDDPGRHQPGRRRVSKSLLALRKQVEDLDPQKQGGNLLSPRRLLGVIPIGDRLVDYFHKYQSSQSHINAIIISLYDGQDELRRDNADIEQEKANLWAIMGRLRQYAYLAAAARHGADGARSPRSRRPIPTGPRSSRRTCSSRCARSARTC